MIFQTSSKKCWKQKLGTEYKNNYYETPRLKPATKPNKIQMCRKTCHVFSVTVIIQILR